MNDREILQDLHDRIELEVLCDWCDWCRMAPCVCDPALQPEYGATSASLSNARLLLRRDGPVMAVRLYYRGSPPDYEALVLFGARCHQFTGFAWGYGGEGPRGLLRFCHLAKVPLDGIEIGSLPNREAQLDPVWSWTR